MFLLKIYLVQFDFDIKKFIRIICSLECSKIQNHCEKDKKAKGLFGLAFFITQFPSLNFHNSSLITHHSSLITHHSFFHTHLATSLLFSSLNFFTLFMGPTPVSWYSVFFFFFSFLFFSFPGLALAFFFFFQYPTHRS